MHTYTYIDAGYILRQWIMTGEDFLKKNIPLTLFERLCVRRSWRLNKDCHILTFPAPPDIAVCRSRSPDAEPEARGLSFPLAFSTTSHPSIFSLTGLQTQSRVPRAPSAGWWLSLPHLVSNSADLLINRGSRGLLLLGGGFPMTSCLQLTDFLSSPTYIIFQSPS